MKCFIKEKSFQFLFKDIRVLRRADVDRKTVPCFHVVQLALLRVKTAFGANDKMGLTASGQGAYLRRVRFSWRTILLL